MGKITKVPNGPLVKKKGPYAGSTLKAGGTVKKAQRGIAIDKTAVKKPKVRGTIKNEPTYKYADKIITPTKKDSLDYKKGYDVGVKRPKDDLQAIFENPAWWAGNIEGRNDKRPQKKISMKGGGKVKKAMLGSSMFKDNPIYKKTTDLRGKIGSAALGIPGMKPIAKGGKMIKRADGSYSQRGLWDNIRANKGSGKKPTKQMLVQEKKIKAKSKK